MTPGHIFYYTESVSKCHCILNRTQAEVIEIANKCILYQLLGVSCGNKKKYIHFQEQIISPSKIHFHDFFCWSCCGVPLNVHQNVRHFTSETTVDRYLNPKQ